MRHETRDVRMPGGFFLLSLVSCLWSLSVWAAQLPSLFRGVVVADSPLGVRVVSVQEASQAALADLRPEDILVRVRDAEVHSIDEFAALSSAMKGRVVSETVLIFRNGAPRELRLHLYSYPVLQHWRVEFIPDDDLRFAEPSVGLTYWARLGRGFDEADKPAEALEAYLNGLHNVPTDTATALKASALFSRVSRQRFREGAVAEGVRLLRQGVVMMDALFEAALTDDQLRVIRDQLKETVGALRAVRGAPSKQLDVH